MRRTCAHPEFLDAAVPWGLYFCIPWNDRLLSYWDRVSDRLFKVRHCMNIEGVVRSLPLWEPPIDPALLVAAAAAGVSIGDALAEDAQGTLPKHRFPILLERAKECAREAQALGSALLSALEKQDGEAVGRLRSRHEVALLDLGREIRRQSIEEAKQNLPSRSQGPRRGSHPRRTRAGTGYQVHDQEPGHQHRDPRHVGIGGCG